MRGNHRILKMILRIFWTLLLLLEVSFSMVDANVDLDAEMLTKESNATYDIAKYNFIDSAIPQLSGHFAILEKTMDAMEDNVCKKQSQLILSNMKNLTVWAMKFYVASGEFPEDIPSGMVYELGDFDECMNIGSFEDTPQGISGQYCLTEIEVEVDESLTNKRGSIWELFKLSKHRIKEYPNHLHWGLCVPAVCTRSDMEVAMKEIFALNLNDSLIRLTPKVPVRNCHKRDSRSIDTADVIYMCAMLLVLSVTAAGTIFHMVCLNKKGGVPPGKVSEILILFSVISNVKKLLSPAHQNDLQLDCLAGIKVISMMLILSGHCLLFGITGPRANSFFFEQSVQQAQHAVYLNNPLLVDTFLLVSAFLFCRILLQELDKRKSVNFFSLFVYRYLRLTPTYLVVLGFYLTLLTKFDSGPLWHRMELEKERCLSSWWTNLLYINNYANTDKICMFQSWYLSVDTQLFLFSPIVIYPLWKWKKYGLYFLIGVTALCMLVPFVVTLMDNLDPTLMFYPREFPDISTNYFFKNVYIKTHMRAESYCFGIIYGYVLYRIQTTGKPLSKRTVTVGWCLAILAIASSLFSIIIFYGPRENFTSIEAALYALLHRALWCLGSGWVILTCVTDNSGPIKKFLSWRAFVPLSRLTYCAYLINGLVELHGVSTRRSTVYFSTYTFLVISSSHEIFTLVGALILSVIFESPILALERMLLRRGASKKTQMDCAVEANSPRS